MLQSLLRSDIINLATFTNLEARPWLDNLFMPNDTDFIKLKTKLLGLRIFLFDLSVDR